MTGSSGGEKKSTYNPVTLQYTDLLDLSCDLSAKIAQAYGPCGLGILTVRGVPQLSDLRQRLLPLAARFASLPESVREKYVDVPSSYNFGWSQGKESLESGHFDVHKGSWYANPLVDDPVGGDQLLMERYPAYCRRNVWPREEFPELEASFKALGSLIIKVGLLLAQHCDKYVEGKGVHPPVKLHHILQDSLCPKGRLLHYFAPKPSAATDDCSDAPVNWCGWHTDHGSLTGLTSAMFLDTQCRPVQSPDPQAGLYVKTREGQVVKVNIQQDELGFQMGEAMQIHSGGFLQATPHCVKAPRPQLSAGISRNTLAVFMQPRWDSPMDPPPGVDLETIGVGQWVPGLTFGEFSSRTIQQYYI